MTTLPEAPPPVIQVVDATDEIVALDLEGEFDISATPEVTEHASRALDAGKHLIVNLSDVTFIDSSMIHALFSADAAAQKVHRTFVLQFGTHASVERVLEITGTDKALRTAPTRDAAIDLIEKVSLNGAGSC
jgi:anti-anti-sigma factor